MASLERRLGNVVRVEDHNNRHAFDNTVYNEGAEGTEEEDD